MLSSLKLYFTQFKKVKTLLGPGSGDWGLGTGHEGKGLGPNNPNTLIYKLHHTNFNAESCYDFTVYMFRLVESYKSYHPNRSV